MHRRENLKRRNETSPELATPLPSDHVVCIPLGIGDIFGAKIYETANAWDYYCPYTMGLGGFL
jgi:hypothetical protein